MVIKPQCGLIVLESTFIWSIPVQLYISDCDNPYDHRKKKIR